MTELLVRERAQLAECEAVIERGMYAFVEVGNALLAIREGKLYRQYRKGITFAEYCKERWGFEHDFARKQIRSAQVVENLKSDTTVSLLPKVETQSRPLTTLSPSQQLLVWKKAVDTAPNGVVTAKHVEAIVKEHKRKARVGSTASQLRLLLVEGYERGAWAALGYDTWTDCIRALADEFAISERHLWRLHAANETEKLLTPGSVAVLPEKHLRPLTCLPAEVQTMVWERAIASAPNGKITAAHVQKVVNAYRPHVAHNGGNNEWYTPAMQVTGLA